MKTFFILTLLLIPNALFAAGLFPDSLVPCNGPDCTICSFVQLGQNILNFSIGISIFIGGIIFAWAGLKMVMSAGNMNEVAAAKKMFTNVVVGLLIVLASWLIINTLMNFFTDQDKIGPWNEVQCTTR